MVDNPHHQAIGTAYEEQTANPNPILALLRRYVPGRTTVFGIAAITTILWRLANLLPPYLLGATIDAFFTQNQSTLSIALIPPTWIPESTRGQFLFVMGAFVTVALVSVGVNAVRLLSWRWMQQSVLHELRTDAFNATQRLDVPFFEAEQTGDVMSVLNNDVNQLSDFLDSGLQNILQMSARFVGILAIMFWLHWQLTIVSLAFAPLMIGTIRIYQRVIEPRYDKRRAVVGALNSRIQNAINGIQTVKAFSNETYERSLLQDRSQSYWRADWNAAKVSGVFNPARQFISNGVMLAILVIGGWWALFGPPLWFSTPLTAGTFVTFYFYSQMFVGQSARVGDLVDAYTDAKASAKRVFGLVNHPATMTERQAAKPLGSIEGHVEYEHISFTYPGSETPALQNLSFEAQAGNVIGLVGPTGAGKSTALKLLLRFYTPDNGTISVDGVDIADVTVESLRRAIGYVSQEPFLFDGTIRENIAYGDRAADHEAIEEAAKRANAYEFIVDLSDGFHTEIGERGVKLSGGQRQRIAIARAIVKDPEILILDEATSHVDNRTELLIQEGLDDVTTGRTTFAVAHRLSTVRHADRLLVFEDGKAVERGTHDELVDKNGVYASLWNVHKGEPKTLAQGIGGIKSN